MKSRPHIFNPDDEDHDQFEETDDEFEETDVEFDENVMMQWTVVQCKGKWQKLEVQKEVFKKVS